MKEFFKSAYAAKGKGPQLFGGPALCVNESDTRTDNFQASPKPQADGNSVQRVCQQPVPSLSPQ